MIFESGSKSYELIKCQTKDSDGEWYETDINLPDELRYFSYSNFNYKVENLKGHDGYFNHLTQTICVTPRAVNDDVTILHEMIHIHEFVINELPMFYHDMLYWVLYKGLQAQIPQLDEILTDHAHLLTGTTLYSAGGVHDILFLLKSFDLDIRMRYPLGTVFAYGRAEEFKNYSYTD